MVNSLPVGLPTRTVLTALDAFGPDVVHLASPFVVGARGLAAARRLRVPAVAVYQQRLDRLLHQFPVPGPLARRVADVATRRMAESYDHMVCTTADTLIVHCGQLAPEKHVERSVDTVAELTESGVAVRR